MQVLICKCEFLIYTDYDLVNNQKAYAQILSIIIQCGELIYQLFTQKFHMEVLSFIFIEVK